MSDEFGGFEEYHGFVAEHGIFSIAKVAPTPSCNVIAAFKSVDNKLWVLDERSCRLWSGYPLSSCSGIPGGIADVLTPVLTTSSLHKSFAVDSAVSVINPDLMTQQPNLYAHIMYILEPMIFSFILVVLKTKVVAISSPTAGDELLLAWSPHQLEVLLMDPNFAILAKTQLAAPFLFVFYNSNSNELLCCLPNGSIAMFFVDRSRGIVMNNFIEPNVAPKEIERVFRLLGELIFSIISCPLEEHAPI